MLRQLRIQNLRCFQDHSLLLEEAVVLVGKNNAGKSTVVEALQLIGELVNKRGGAFTQAPKWVPVPRFQQCATATVVGLSSNSDTLFHRYGKAPAEIIATFKEGITLHVYVGEEDKIFASISTGDRFLSSFQQLSGVGVGPLLALPQISPVQREEELLSDSYIESKLYTRLASRHFRNQVFRDPDAFDDFKSLAEDTWPGLRISRPETIRQRSGPPVLSVIVTDGDFSAEVGWMGHGLQMWLQTIWFVSRTPSNATVVLDEPDVYMHPDLQRKLFRILKSRFAQAIVATHSIEIMAEADPSEILVIDKRKRRSQYANSEPAVQSLVDRIGGVHNVHLARLWSAKRFLLVEGEDVGLLRHLFDRLFPKAQLSLDSIPSLSIGGWNGWLYAVGSAMTLHNAVGDAVITYCLLDSDYHTLDQKRERYEDAAAKNVRLHIWSRKELENYLLCPAAISRLIRKRNADNVGPEESLVSQKLLEFCELERDNTTDAIAAELFTQDKRLQMTAHKRARDIVSTHWKSCTNRLAIVSGKALLSHLSGWAQEEFGVSFGAAAVARQMRATEISREVAQVLEAIHDGTDFGLSVGRAV